jgi:hypothetical protein
LEEMRPALDELRAASASQAEEIIKCESRVQHLQNRTKQAREVLKVLTKDMKPTTPEKEATGKKGKDGSKKDSGGKDAAAKKAKK